MIDIIEDVASSEGWTIQYAPCVWNNCLEKLENAEIDLLVGIAYTPERAKEVQLQPAYRHIKLGLALQSSWPENRELR